MQSLFMMRKVLGMPWSPPDWGDLSEVHVCAHELLGCINGEELKWGNAGFFKKPFFIHCCWFCRAKLYFYPPVATWTYISKGYWNLLWHSGSRRAWRGTPFSDSFSASPAGWCYCLQLIFPVQLWLCNTKFIGVWHSPAALILLEFAERWFCY